MDGYNFHRVSGLCCWFSQFFMTEDATFLVIFRSSVINTGNWSMWIWFLMAEILPSILKTGNLCEDSSLLTLCVHPRRSWKMSSWILVFFSAFAFSHGRFFDNIFQPLIGRKIKILQLRSEKHFWEKNECNSIKCYFLPSYSILQTSQIDEFSLNRLCSCLDRNMLIYILITT